MSDEPREDDNRTKREEHAGDRLDGRDNSNKQRGRQIRAKIRRIVVIACLVGGVSFIFWELLCPARQMIRNSALRTKSANNLWNIGTAFRHYESKNGKLPPPAIYDDNGTPLLSWRVAILPYLGEGKLYEEFRLNEPWDSESNKKLLGRMPDVFKLPHERGGSSDETTYYRVFTGPETLFDGKSIYTFATIPDGMSDVILVVEAGEPVIWTKPEELEYDAAKPIPSLGGVIPGQEFRVLLSDGSVKSIHRPYSEERLRAAIMPADGQPLVPPF